VSARYGSCLFTVATAVLVAVLGVTSAGAATTWTILPGGPVSLKATGTLVLTDTKTRANIVCAPSQFSGMLKSGSGLPGSGIGAITAGSFGHCSNALGPNFVVTAPGLPWHLSFTSYNAAKGAATGTVRHIQIKVAGPGTCDPVIDGTSGTATDGLVKFTYTNSTARLRPLAIGGNLHFYNTSGCAGLFNTGDPVSLSATLTVSPSQTITGP
jgi:hypothetical protein